MSTLAENKPLLAWQDFLRAHKTVLGALEREMLEDSGLPLAWYDVLVQLDAAPEKRLRLQALAERILLSRSGLTRLIDRMETAGLVCREPCPDDRRGTFAVLTPAGRERLRKAAPGHLRGVRQHFTGRLTQADIAALRSAFAKVLNSQDGAPTAD